MDENNINGFGEENQQKNADYTPAENPEVKAEQESVTEAQTNPFASQAEEYRRQQEQEAAAPQQPQPQPQQPTQVADTNYGAQRGAYTQQPYSAQRPQYNPYNQAPQQRPYGQPNQNPYSRQGVNPNQQGYQRPYGQPNQNPYNRQGAYNPYAQNNAYRPQGPQAPYQQGYANPTQHPYQTAPVAPQQTGSPKSGAGKKVFFIVVALLLVCAITGATLMTRNLSKSKAENASSGVTQSAQDGKDNKKTASGDAKIAIAGAPAEGDALATDAIAEKARASCVGVLVYTNANTSAAAGQGTGILVPIEAKSADSKKYTYVLTCAHVIDDSNVSVKVQLEDGTSYDAEIVGYDSRTDVGVLRIEATGLSVCEIGDSGALKVGSAVYAVGNPGGIEFFGSFTDGIVSAIDRPIDSQIGYTMSCIQHTAAINPGNSGGALVNAYGQVIGINSQKIASDSYEGMGFAIPINSAVKIADDLISYGYIKDRAKLGITYYALSTSSQYSLIAKYNNLPSGTLIINTISSDSALAGTDVKQYDMITAVDGKELDTADVLLSKIESGKPGDKLKLTISRINNDYTISSFDVTVTLVEDKGSKSEEQTTQQNLYPFGSYGFGN